MGNCGCSRFVPPYRFSLKKTSVFLQASSWARECATISPPHRAITAKTTGNWNVKRPDFEEFLSPSTASQSEVEPTWHTCVNCFERAGSDVWGVWRFYQVTCVRVRQDSQQVAISRPLHHLPNLETGRKKISYLSDGLMMCFYFFNLVRWFVHLQKQYF